MYVIIPNLATGRAGRGWRSLCSGRGKGAGVTPVEGLAVIVSWDVERGLGWTCFSPDLPQGMPGEVGGHCELGGSEGVGIDLLRP